MKNYFPRKTFGMFLCLVLFTLPTNAKDREHSIQGRVVENISREAIPAFVTLMTADSVVVDTITASVEEDPYMGGTVAFYVFRKVLPTGKYILKATYEGYYDTFVNCEIRSSREASISVKPIRMAKMQHKELDEVVVTATKVKMVMKGDTIVYNADAFNLAEGSMLDALISRLPNTTLTKDGEIYVNGKYVQSLLVNGQEFFAGNPKLALENLPSYTVNKVKVYDQEGTASRMMGQDMGDKSYVMDVRLKKEYAVGYMGNIEAGAGTKKRYQARLFGMKFSEKERLGAFVNINNLNDNQRAALSGEWSPQDVGNGLLTTKTAGVSYIRFLGNMFSWFSTDNTWTHTNADIQSATNSQTFLTGGDAYQKSRNCFMSSSDNWQTNNSLLIDGDVYSTTNFLILSYLRRNGLGSDETETSDETSPINRMLSANSLKSDNFDFSLEHSSNYRIIADMVRWGVSLKLNRNTQEKFTIDDLRSMTGQQPRDYRNNYLDALNQNLTLSSNISYDYGTGNIHLQPGYTYTYNYNKAENMLYRLDKLSGRDNSRYDLLPSAIDALKTVADEGNTYQYREYRNEHRLNFHYMNLHSKLIDAEVLINLPLRLANAHLYYDRMGRHDVTRKKWFFEPDLWLRGEKDWELTAKIYSEMPDLTAMVGYRDDSNPLRIVLGNPELKDIHHYDVNASKTFRGTKQLNLSIRMGYHKTDNATAYALAFNKQTGVTTIQPVSVNGNWRYNFGVDFSRSLDKKQKFTIGNQLIADYNHNVDMASVGGLAESRRSIVNNWKIGDNLKINYRPNDRYELTLHGGGNYYLISSKREGFDNIHAGDYNVGMNAQVQLPFEFQLTTDITMFARTGYQQSEMNTTDWIWNAQLTREIIRGRLLAKLQGFDLLHQLSNTQYLMNAQGRTETWRNSIPRYVMLTLSYRFNVNPKKR